MMTSLRAFFTSGNVIILAVLVVVAGFVSDYFWTVENSLNVIRVASLVGIIAIGMNVVIIGGGIDLSVGSIVALTGTIAASLQVLGAPVALVFCLPLFVALAAGLANGTLVGGFGLQPFVATLVLMTVARGVGLVYTGGQPIYADYPDSFLFLSRGTVLGVPFPVILFFVVALLTWHLMRWRVFGREVYATGANETAARLSGVTVGRVKLKSYLYCAFLAGLSGLVLTSRMESGEPGQAGLFWELDAIAAVVIGGTAIRGGSGSIWGAVAGALVIAIIANLFNLLGVGPAWQQVAKGVIIVLAVLMQVVSERGGIELRWPALPPVKPIFAVIGVVVVFNAILSQAVPSLFQIDLAKAPYTRANNLELTRVYHRAIPLYEEVIARFPDSDYALRARLGIANSARGTGDLVRAEDIYQGLLAGIAQGSVPETLRFDVLKNYATLLQETAELAPFEQVFAQLERHYPDSDATREARVVRDQLRAATAGADTGVQEGPIVVKRVSLPATAQVGERIELVIELVPNGDVSPDFSLMTNLAFWKGFKLVRLSPPPRTNTEFWGRRAWGFGGVSEPMTLTATLEALTPGSWAFDLDVERDFEVLEYGIVRTVVVGGAS